MPDKTKATASGRGWVRRHKVWTGVIAVSALIMIGSFNQAPKKTTSSSPSTQISPSPTPESTESLPSPTALGVPSTVVTTAPPLVTSPPVADASVVVTAPPKTTPAPAPTNAPVSRPPATSTLTCVASVSNEHPNQNSTVDVFVTVGQSNIGIRTVAHYKTTDTTHEATTDGNGKATVAYKIGRASKGYQVVVDVSVTGGPSCQTNFTPQ